MMLDALNEFVGHALPPQRQLDLARDAKRTKFEIIIQGWLALMLVTTGLASQPSDEQESNQRTFLPQVFQQAPYRESLGILDPDFGGTGWATADFYGQDTAHAIAIQADGKIVVLGYNGYAYESSVLALARYNPDGSLDPSFGRGGRVVTDFGNISNPGNAIAVQPDDKIVVAGKTGYESNNKFALARYNPDGSLVPQPPSE